MAVYQPENTQVIHIGSQKIYTHLLRVEHTLKQL